MDYRFVPRPTRMLLKFGALYPMLERVAADMGLAVAIPLNGFTEKRVRAAIRKTAWKRYGMRLVTTVDKKQNALIVWPVETDLESGLPPEARGGIVPRWEVINAQAPARTRQPAPAR